MYLHFSAFYGIVYNALIWDFITLREEAWTLAVTIESVSPGSPAAKKKIQSGDKLLSINGHAISDVLDYRFYINEEKLVLEVEKNGKNKKIKKKKD